MKFANFFNPILRSLRLLSSRDKFLYFSFVAARVVTNLLDVFGLAAVGLFGTMLGAGLRSEDSVEFGPLTLSLEQNLIYLWVILSTVALFLFKSVLGVVLLRATGLFLARVEGQAANLLMKELFGDDLTRIKRFSESRIHYAVTNSSAMAFGDLLVNLNVLITEASLFVFVFVAFAVVDWQAAVVMTLYFAILLGGFQIFIGRRLRNIGVTFEKTSRDLVGIVIDMTRAYREIAVFSKLEPFLERFTEMRSLSARTRARMRFYEGSPRFLVESALMLGVLAMFVWQFFRGSLAEGLVVTAVFLAGGLRIMAALLPLQNALSWIRINGPQAEDAQQLIEDFVRTGSIANSGSPKVAVEPLDRNLEPIAGPYSVEVSDVEFQFPGSASRAVSGLSLSVDPGANAAIIGPSGAGKTTLVDIMLGLLEPSSGVVRIAGQSPRDLLRKFPGSLAYVPQKPGMISGTVAENVALGDDPGAIEDVKVITVLQQVGLWEGVSTRGGLEARIGSQADAFSGGQLQRLGLARALYRDPRVLILDEATSALDAKAENEIVELLFSLRGRVTVIVIAHRLSTVQRMDRVFAIDDGRLLGAGNFSELRRRIPLVEEYVQLMSFNSPTDS